LEAAFLDTTQFRSEWARKKSAKTGPTARDPTGAFQPAINDRNVEDISLPMLDARFSKQRERAVKLRDMKKFVS
jgi:hypothetical protein